MEILIPIIAVGGFFAAAITWIYMSYKSKHQQRMALIDSGQSADIFVEKKLDKKANALKTGMFLTGGGLGFFFGTLIEQYSRLQEGMGFIPLSFVGGGLGLILFYSVVSKREDEEQEKVH
jgi:hypothetical protein